MAAEKSKKRGLARPLIIIFALALALGLATGVYAGTYSRADAEAVAAFSEANKEDGAYSFGSSDVGLIFYPGGKVEYSAYAPLAKRISEEAVITCIVAKMPLNLAVFDADAAKDIIAAHPEVGSWYIGGHSLGGAMAASFAAKNPDMIAGVALLAAYSTEPLAMPVISIYGELDTVLNAEKYEECRANLPEGCQELMIPGGNHALFGNYGGQKGDSTAKITAAEQQEAAAKAIAAWLATLE